MKLLTRILRTGAGSPPNWSCHYLKRLPSVHLTLADASPMSVGFFSECCDDICIIPYASSEDFITGMLQICREKRIDILLPAVDEELIKLSKAKNSFKEIGTVLLLSDFDSISICLDKWVFAQKMKEWDLPHPGTWIADSFTFDHPPYIVKPRTGRGSTGVHILKTEEDLRTEQRTKEFIIQEFIPGKEYTVDTLSSLEGTFLYGCPRERIKTDSGISIVGETVEDTDAIEIIKTLLNNLQIKGPANVQYIRPDKKRIIIIEINPRLSGGVALTEGAGVHLMEDILRLSRGEPIPQRKTRTGVKMFREWREIFVEPQELI